MKQFGTCIVLYFLILVAPCLIWHGSVCTGFFRNFFKARGVVKGAVLLATPCFMGCKDVMKEHLLSQREEVRELCVMTSIVHSHDACISGSILKLASQKWLRPAGKERWEFTSNMNFSLEEKDRVLNLFDSLGFIRKQQPQRSQYTYVCVLSGIVPRMDARLQYLVTLWKQGIRWEHIVFLSGDRLLDERVDHVGNSSIVGAKNEAEALAMLWDGMQREEKIPRELQQIPITRITAKSIVGEQGTIQRPTTQDTIHQLLQETGTVENASYLFISSQPFVPYQLRVVRHTFKDQRNVYEVVGGEYEAAGCGEGLIGILFDSLGRSLYFEDKLYGIFSEKPSEKDTV